MASLLQDLRYALRVLARAPVFTAITVITMAIGTGANVTVFSFVNALLVRPASGVVDPDSLVAIYTSDYSSGPYGQSSYPDYLDLKASVPALTNIAAESGGGTAVMRTDEVVERVRVSSVTGNYFSLLGVEAAEGRLIGPGDASPDAPPVAIIGHALRHRAFAPDTPVIGATLALNGHVHEIIGVAPEPFSGLSLGRAVDVWTPLAAPRDMASARQNRGLSLVARLAPSATLASAQVQTAAVAARLAAAYPESNRGILGAPDQPRPIIVLAHTRLSPEFRGMVTTLSGILMGAVGLVLLIACANIASLLLSRATARDREMAIRLALGAGRGRVVRQLLTESLILGLAGGAFGLLFSLWTSDALPSFFPAEQARLLDSRIDGTALVFLLGVSFGCSLLFGLAPALQAAGPGASDALRGGPGRVSDTRARTTLRQVMVAAQIAVAVILLIGAVLLTRSVTNIVAADPGFGTRDGVVASVELPGGEFTPQRGLLYYRDAIERVKAVPGVDEAALARTLPTSLPSRRGFQMQGYQPQPGEDTELPFNQVSAGYFETLRIPLLAGRTFDQRDGPDGRRVVVVNDLLSQRYFGGRATGRTLTDSSGATLEIIGVVRTTVSLTVQSPPTPVVYYPLTQAYASRMTVIARTSRAPAALIEPIRRELAAVSRAVPVFRVMTLSAHLAEAAADSRLTATLLVTCGAMALLLATIGVYGVLAYAVARRTKEIGVRVALGARPRHIVRLVLSEGLRVTAAGIACGLLGAIAVSRTLESLLFGVTTSDPLTYVLVPAVLTAIALLAAYAPARRALRVEPNAVLRQE